MSSENNPIFNSLQQGFRITVGAAASLVETLQDSQKRQLTLQDLQQEWGKKAEQWAEKGSATEIEARQYVDQWLAQIRKTAAAGNANGDRQTIDFATAQAELERLTQDIITLKDALANDKASAGKS